MGVPKFFRYMSERYPCLSEVVREYQIPEYDNLYLDMNGIIHTCSHPNDCDPHFHITEEKIYQDIFHYIEILFHMIKPQKLFFMAVDGVAPRAKMNQQRARRFRSAQKDQIMITEARRRGTILPEEAKFDSNCITPGTIFMTRLNEQLKYFVTRKITTDKLWQKCKIILSGHETPGEGEHKIMDYIRYMKSQPDYDTTTRHCLYGLDADLIMLGLCSHEPNFSLLREEDEFGKKQKRVSTPEGTNFFLLHLSILREYIGHEFSSIKSKLSFQYDIERIIDDWVLMGFLIGNDFIPNLPNLHIADGALPTLYSAYKDVLPTLNGYINEGGTLMLDRFEKFLKRLGRLDIEPFATEEEIVRKKRDYYMKKLGYRNVDANVLRSQAECYVRAIQWNLNYYYNGCCSWSWYYPHHYAPFISDIKGFGDSKFEFETGKPFQPFQQLLAVLPAASRSLLPIPFQSLMIDARSPIRNYYPIKFDSDLNGKKQEWEAVLLIPFIEERKLIKAMEPCYVELTEEENQRNSHGPMHVYFHTDEDLGSYEAPEYFQKLLNNHAKSEQIIWEDIIIPKEKLVKGLSPGIKLDVYYPGFPTLKHIEHTAELRSVEAKGFNNKMSKRKDKVLIHILPLKKPNLANLADQILGKSVFVSWPHLVEARVVAISDRETIFKLPDDPSQTIVKRNLKGPSSMAIIKLWERSKKTATDDYINRLGINVGETEVLISAREMIGRRYIFGEKGKFSLEKQWSDLTSAFLLQAIVNDITVQDSTVVPYTNIRQIFAPKSICFLLKNPHYGAMGEVVKVRIDFKICRIKLDVRIAQEPNFDSLKEARSKSNLEYMPSRIAAKKLAISSHLFSRMTGSIQVKQLWRKRNANLGLNLKFNKTSQEMPGYTKKVDGEWLYSTKTIDVMRAYMEKYPSLFEHLAKNIEADIYEEDGLFPVGTGSTSMNEVLVWLENQPFHNAKSRRCGTKGLEVKDVEELETVVDEFMKEQELISHDEKTTTMQAKPHSLYKSSLYIGNFPPDPTAEHQIYDRIVSIGESFTVPLGYKGTIVGIQKALKVSDTDLFDVVFDKPFPGGFSLIMCSANRGYRLAPRDFINISYGVRCSDY